MRRWKARFLSCLLGAVLCAGGTIFFLCVSAWHATVLLAAGAVVLTVLSFHFSESYRAARLITENPILKVDVASVAETDAREPAASCVNAVVSGFGILIDGKAYQFGQGSVNLMATRIDRESITLSFGDKDSAYSVRLLHGIADKAEVGKLTERLRYETGVIADVSGW